MAKLKTITIDGRAFSIEVDNDGRFHAEHDGDALAADTLAEIEKKLRARCRRAKVRLSLPVSVAGVVIQQKDRYGRVSGRRIDGIGTMHATITGLHAQNSDVLLEYPDGEKERRGRWGEAGFLTQRLSNAQIAEYVRLATADRDAHDALEAWKKKHAIDDPAAYVREHAAAQLDEADERDVVTDGDPR